jgi:hypothetical protein
MDDFDAGRHTHHVGQCLSNEYGRRRRPSAQAPDVIDDADEPGVAPRTPQSRSPPAGPSVVVDTPKQISLGSRATGLASVASTAHAGALVRPTALS